MPIGEVMPAKDKIKQDDFKIIPLELTKRKIRIIVAILESKYRQISFEPGRPDNFGTFTLAEIKSLIGEMRSISGTKNKKEK